MVQPAHELRNGPLEVDVVLPQRVVGIDEKSLGGDWHRLCMINGETGDRRHRRHRASSPSSVVVPPISATAAKDVATAVILSGSPSSVLVPPISAMAAMTCDVGDLEISRSPDAPIAV